MAYGCGFSYASSVSSLSILREHSIFESFIQLKDNSVQQLVHVQYGQIGASMQASNSSEQLANPDLYSPVSEVRPLVGGLMQVDMAGSQTHHKLAAIAKQDGCRYYSPVIGKASLHDDQPAGCALSLYMHHRCGLSMDMQSGCTCSRCSVCQLVLTAMHTGS